MLIKEDQVSSDTFLKATASCFWVCEQPWQFEVRDVMEALSRGQNKPFKRANRHLKEDR